MIAQPSSILAHVYIDWLATRISQRVSFDCYEEAEVSFWLECLHKRAISKAPLTAATMIAMSTVLMQVQSTLASILIRPHYKLPIVVTITVGNIVPDLKDYEDDPWVKQPFHAVADTGLQHAALFLRDRLGYEITLMSDDWHMLTAESTVLMRIASPENRQQ